MTTTDPTPEGRRKAQRAAAIRGCLLGGAVGDALGAPVEFDSLETMHKRFGPTGLVDLEEAYGRKGAITDDTQLTLFTAEGLLRAEARRRRVGTCDVPSVVRLAYLRWLHTQDAADGVDDVSAALHPDARGWLVDEPFLHAVREPGTTCLAGLRTGRIGSTTDRLNDRKGCGGVMRVAPVGLVEANPFALACEVAALTHGHPTGFLAAGAFAVAIEALHRGRSIREAVACALDSVATHPEGGEVVASILAAIAAADRGVASALIVESLGEGWTAEEAVSIAFYCALVEPEVKRALLLAVHHSGDSDSTGSMVGQLLGTAHGADALPSAWTHAVEGRATIERVAQDLVTAFVEGKALPPEAYPAC